MKIARLTKNNTASIVRQAVSILRKGGLVIYPTETCYGAGVDATNPLAVRKLLAYKTKRAGKAISIAVCDARMARKYVLLNETARNLYKDFLPGPLTVVSRSRGTIVRELEAEDKTIGVRIPNHRLALAIVRRFGKPITATSANASNRKTPYSIRDILGNISRRQRNLLDLIIDAGRLPKNKPSTIIHTLLNDERILRQGDVALKNSKHFLSRSEVETRLFAGNLFAHLQKISGSPTSRNLKNRATVFALQGELGVGKTQFAKGVAAALDIATPVTSPTFVLMREYQAPSSARTIYHIDAYRMEGAENEMESLGLLKRIKSDDIVVIEWAEKVRNFIENLKKTTRIIWIKFAYAGDTKRKIEYSETFI